MKKMYFLLFMIITGCSVQLIDTTPNNNEHMVSVAEYGIDPDTEISSKLTQMLENNPEITDWYFPEGEYLFDTISPELLQQLSQKRIYGSTQQLTVFKFTSVNPYNSEWANATNLSFHHIAWKNTRIIIKGDSSNIEFNGNIFYGLQYSGVQSDDMHNGDHRADHVIVFGDYSGSAISKNLIVKNSVFLRSANKKHAYRSLPLPTKNQAADESNPSYMIRREYGIRLFTAQNIVIENNVFGLKNSQTVTSQSTDLLTTINKAKKYILTDDEAHSIYAKDQTYFTTAINTVPNSSPSSSVTINNNDTGLDGTLPINMVRNIRIINNYIHGWFAGDYMDKAYLSGANEINDDNRFFDHAIYLRGTENVIVAGNYVTGYPNDSAGGIKFKSGINISVVKNYFDNTGLILARSWELGRAGQKEGLYFKVLVKDNVFNITNATGSYKMGITYDDELIRNTTTDVNLLDLVKARVRKVVFTDNKFTKMTVNTMSIGSTNNSPNNPVLLRLDDLRGITDKSGIQVNNNRYDKFGDYSSLPYFNNVTQLRVIEDRSRITDTAQPIYLYNETSTLFQDVLDQHNDETATITIP